MSNRSSSARSDSPAPPTLTASRGHEYQSRRGRAEALFTFLVFVSMLLILWHGADSRRVRWPVALLAGLLAGCAVDVRSEGLPVLVLFPVALLIRGLRQDGGWRWRRRRAWLAAAAMAVGCVAPVAAYVGWFHSWYGSYPTFIRLVCTSVLAI